MTTNDNNELQDDSFHKLMSDIKPLKQDKHKPYTHKIVANHIGAEEKSPPNMSLPFVSKMHKKDSDLLGADDKVTYNSIGIASKTIKQLQQGKILIEASCDLHGMNVAAAELQLENFIARCLQHRLRCVRIVHGKSGKYAIMKSWCVAMLKLHDKVLAVSSCIPKHGGTGAIYVLLKTRQDHEFK
jgi:DNA-nicking Smr family endonuclease